MRAVYDQKAQTLYVYVSEERVSFSDELISDLVFADYDKDRNIVGVEILGVDEFIDMSKFKDLRGE